MGNSVFGLRLSESEHAYLDGIASQTDGILSKAGVLRVLVRHAQASGWDPLGASGTLGLAEATKASPSSSSYIEENTNNSSSIKKEGGAGGKRDPYAVKAISPDLVPDDLLDCQQLLPEFWAAKKGTRSQGVWNRVCGKLRQWTPNQRREALERAISSGWGDVFEPKAAPASRSTGGGGRKPLDQLASEMDAMPSLW